MKAIPYLLAAGVLLALLVTGCGQPKPPTIVEVAGIVLLDGKPLKKVAVRFVPMTDYGPDYFSTGVTDDNGRFTLTCPKGPGACACAHRVTVTEAEIPANLKSEDLKVQEDHQTDL